MKKIILILCFSLLACSESTERSSVVAVSVSSDGRYILSSHHGKKLWLWDIKNKTHKEISNDANIYSPYFIKGTNKFIWQDVIKNQLHLVDIKGNDLKVIKLDYPSYGHVATIGLKNYIYSTNLWQLRQIKSNHEKEIKHSISGVESFGKLLNLSIDDSEHYLVTSGDTYYDGNDLPLSAGLTAKEVNPKMPENRNYSLLNGVVLWDARTGKPLRKLIGNRVKTYATLSPDGHYVVAGDENSKAYVWKTSNGEKLFRLSDLVYGDYIEDDSPRGFHRPEQSIILKRPKDYCQKIDDHSCFYQDHINAIKFISKGEYLRFTEGVPYVILYEVLNPRPKKYFSLRQTPYPKTMGYMIPVDTAPDKGILVMAQSATWNIDENKNSGINVYQYDKKNQSLKLIWAPEGPKAFKRTLKTYE